ncbi:hypothetical protein RclHR1_06700011 [Rhizophagus clarus]|uniref:Uncharacterized protein n=1 Tax=Rhizophagus clarus TaxID=94130 RepID=A0A2Z6SJB4_9GLOM|nr:hypothetical protein RclHR1_06700011 [Rhizophagus clarus]GES95778.1 hypothetical protein GLOIN_2v1705675 [Rhizophagus clarus]
MSDAINIINNNNDSTENKLKNLENVFPDPTEDVFWQKVSTVINEIDEDSTNNVDAIWNPHKKELNVKQKQKDQENNNFIIAPPPHHPITNNYTRHSRKSSRVSWGLQTDSERHIELLEKKLNEVISNHKGTHTRSSTMDFDNTPLSTLGYYSEEEMGSGTAFEDEEDNDLNLDNHNPQESDEGLWLLWKNQSMRDFQGDEQHNNISTTINQSWYLPILSRSNNNDDDDSNNNLPRLTRMRSENYVANYRDVSNEFPYYDEDEEDGYDLNDEILLNRAKRKKEKEYLKFNARSYDCCGCNTTNGLCVGLWGSWCCNWVCLPTILFMREKCCCGACGLDDD